MTKEKREKKKRNNFPNAFDRFNKKKRIVTLKFNIYSMITLQSRTLSIILCVFKSQEEDTRKKGILLLTCSWIRIARIAETLWNETKWWVSDSRDYLGGDGGGEPLERKREEWVKLVLAFARPPRKIHFSCSATLFLAQFLSNTKEASSASLESLNRRIQFNNSFLFTYINAIDTVLQFSRVESSGGSTADNVKHRRLDFSITFLPSSPLSPLLLVPDRRSIYHDPL